MSVKWVLPFAGIVGVLATVYMNCSDVSRLDHDRDAQVLLVIEHTYSELVSAPEARCLETACQNDAALRRYFLRVARWLELTTGTSTPDADPWRELAAELVKSEGLCPFLKEATQYPWWSEGFRDAIPPACLGSAASSKRIPTREEVEALLQPSGAKVPK